MAINYNGGTPTTKIFLKSGITNEQYSEGFYENGALNTSVLTSILESEYIDIGIVTDEREELSLGGVSWSAPGSSASQRIFWAISGKVLRVTISGFIPDGTYVVTEGTTYANKSNSSVFRTKLNKLIGYLSVYEAGSLTKLLHPCSIYYRRKGIYEYTTGIPEWILTNYSISYIEGTRNMRYTLSLDFSNNDQLIANAAGATGITAREFGDIQ